MEIMYHFTTVRKFLLYEGVKRTVFGMVCKMLGFWKDPPREFMEDFENLVTSRPRRQEELVAFPSFTVLKDAYYPAFTVYKSADVRDSNMGVIFEYEEIDPNGFSGLLSDSVWKKLQDMPVRRREELLEKGRSVLPRPVPWDKVSDPMSIMCNSPRMAAMLCAWALKDRGVQKYGYFPFFIGPRSAEDPPIAIYVYEELSRYKALFTGQIRFAIDRMLEDLTLPDEWEWDEDEDEELTELDDFLPDE